MGVSLSIKNVPDEVVERLRARAMRNHRSLQGELLHIVVNEAEQEPFDAAVFMAESRRLGLSTPDEATVMIREDRDSDHGRR